MQEVTEAMGVTLSPPDIRDYKLSTIESNLPEEYELARVPVKNQLFFSTCVAHALSSVVEYYTKVQLGKDVNMSINYIYGNRRNTSDKGEGMVLREALKNLREYGDVPRDHCTGNNYAKKAIAKFEEAVQIYEAEGKKNRISSYIRLTNEKEIKTFLHDSGPVVFAMNWHKDMSVTRGGMLTSDYRPDDIKCSHCMMIYGWTKEGWKVQNSWGVVWGNEGTCILPFDKTDEIREAWGLADNITEDGVGNIKRPFSSKIGRFFAKIINSFLRLFRKN